MRIKELARLPAGEIDTLMFDLDGTIIDISKRAEILFYLRAFKRFKKYFAKKDFNRNKSYTFAKNFFKNILS